MPKTSDPSSPAGTSTLNAFGGLFTVVDCGSTSHVGLPALTTPGVPILYERLGGLEGVRSLVHDFLTVIEDDHRIKTLLCPVELKRLRPLLAERIAEATGGPCECSEGRTTQAGLLITMYHLRVLIDDLSMSLERSRVPVRDAAELISLFAPIPRPYEKRPRPKAETAL